MNKQKILIVDDDANIAELIALYLTKECFDTRMVHDGEMALEVFDNYQPNLIILDLMLPGIDGYQVCREIRAKSNTPIIMLSAKGEVFDKVLGLELGADDYIVKPFEFDELLARINALYRRSHQIHSFDYSYGDIKYLIDSRTIQCGDRSVQLTNRESQLFELLLRSAGKLVSHDEIIEAIWGLNSNVGNGNILNYVYFLRNRLKTVHSRITIKGVYGSGYTLVYEKEESPK